MILAGGDPRAADVRERDLGRALRVAARPVGRVGAPGLRVRAPGPVVGAGEADRGAQVGAVVRRREREERLVGTGAAQGDARLHDDAVIGDRVAAGGKRDDLPNGARGDGGVDLRGGRAGVQRGARCRARGDPAHHASVGPVDGAGRIEDSRPREPADAAAGVAARAVGAGATVHTDAALRTDVGLGSIGGRRVARCARVGTPPVRGWAAATPHAGREGEHCEREEDGRGPQHSRHRFTVLRARRAVALWGRRVR